MEELLTAFEPDGPFPIAARIAGVDVVTIPISEYARLLAADRNLAIQAVSHGQLMSPKRSVIERNPEVAVFLAQKFGLLPMKDILRHCRREFGRQRTPSQSTAYRYWQKLRKAASNIP